MQEQDNMPDSSSPAFQGPAHLVSDTGFSASGDESKITSYMWYIHVTVRVNAADRLRDRIARLLDSSTTNGSNSSLTSPLAPFDLDGIHIARSGSSSVPGHKGGVDGTAASELDDFTDYLVLDFFLRVMLETLVGTAPIEEHMDGYARVLADIPEHFREAFCRRLYCLLFSKYILEWPHGIAAPEPAPGSIAAAAAAAAATTTNNAAVVSSTGHEATTASTGSETTVENGKRISVRACMGDDKEDGSIFDMDEFLADDKGNDTFDGEDVEYPTSPGPASPGYQSTLGPSSPWPDTPSLGCSPELARAAYFGTVSDPQPIQYMRDWGRSSGSISGSIISSRDDGTARAAGACAGAGAGVGAGGSHDESLLSPRWNRRHEAPPHATPQARRSASLVAPALRRDQQQVSHTGSCCPCRVREAWLHGVGPQR